MRRGSSIALPVVLLSVAGGFVGHRYATSFASFIVAPHRQQVRYTVPPDEVAGAAARFALACAFMAASAPLAAAVTRPGASVVAMASWTFVFLVVTALAFGCAAVLSRYRFSAFVLEANQTQTRAGVLPPADRVAKVTLSDVPTARVPVIAGLCTLVAGAVTRSAAARLTRVGGTP